MDHRVCTKCLLKKKITAFPKSWLRPTGSRGRIWNGHRARVCNKCQKNKTAIQEKEYRSLRRQKYPHTFIVHDSKQSDQRHGRQGNDLDREFVRDLIQNGCSYCGSKSLRITLDRIDNNKAHMKDNVIPACIRCNYVRNDMPYEAWKQFIPVIKLVTEMGIFGEWRSQPWRSILVTVNNRC